MNQKHIEGSKLRLESETAFPVSERTSLSINMKYLVGSVLATYCESIYLVHVIAVKEKILIDRAFWIRKCVAMEQISCH